MQLALAPAQCILHLESEKEYVPLLIGLYKDHGSVLHVAIILLYTGVWQDVSFTLVPSCMGSCHGQILMVTETYSYYD